MPVFFRAGCNSGGCHGAAIRQGRLPSLALRLRSRRRLLPPHPADPRPPHRSRRARAKPAALKATGAVPHTGGRRFKPDSEYYNTLLHWIQAGAPDDAANVPQVTGISLVPDKIVFTGKEKTQAACRCVAKYSDGILARGQQPRALPHQQQDHRRYRRSTASSRPASAATRSSSRASPSTPPAPKSSSCRPARFKWPKMHRIQLHR